MTSHRSAPATDAGVAAAASLPHEAQDLEALDDLSPASLSPASGLERSAPKGVSMRETGAFPKAPPAPQGSLDSAVVEELTRRLPTSELVKIIKGALECGRRNLPFTESDFLRAMTFGSSALPSRLPPRGPRPPRG
jgi:hypothetical protein